MLSPTKKEKEKNKNQKKKSNQNQQELTNGQQVALIQNGNKHNGDTKRNGISSHHLLPSEEDNSESTSIVDDNSASLTLQQTHLIENEGQSDVLKTEEHFTSEIKSFVVVNPPKFKQRIKAYRLKSIDRVTLVAEVQSWPVAEFEWFCNDKPVNEIKNQDTIFTVKTSGNVSIMNIQNSQKQTEETSNLIIGILSPPPTPEPTTTHSKSTKRPPRFLTDVPNLALINSEIAVVDVEVRPVADSFTWYLDGHLIAEIIPANTSEDVFPIDSANATFFLPKSGQCVAHFKEAKPGRYTCVAKNEAGIAKSTGFIERISDLNSISNIHSNLLRETTLPPISSEGRGGSRERFSGSRTKTTIHTTTVVHRSSSLPKRKASGESSRADSEFDSSLIVRPKMATPEKESVNADRTPIIPNFVVFPPPTICLSKQMQKTLELHVACQAYPPAQITWFINGKGLAEELEKNEYRVLTEHNESRLLVESGGEGGLPKEGIYVAEASNAYGTGRCETMVTISDDLSTIDENSLDDSETVTKIIQKRVERQELFEQDSDEEDEFLNEKEGNSDDKFFVSTQTIEEAPMREVEQIHILQQKRPEIVLAPDSRIFVPGGLPLVLELKADSESDCTIRWYLKNFELHPNGNTVIVENLERNHEKLTILNPTEGIYKAVIQNDHGMATYECRVLVEVPPQSDQDLPEFMQRSRALLLKSPTPPPIFKPEKQRPTKEESEAVKRIDIAPKIISEFEEVYRIGENMPFELDVKAEARPEAQFQWKHNNFEIKSNDQVQIKHAGENNEKISFAKAVDGIVEVHAVNKLGKDIKRTKVIVDYNFDPSNENNVNKKLTEEMEERKEGKDEGPKKLEKRKKDTQGVKENGDLEGVETSKKKDKKIADKAKETEAKDSLENDLISIEKQEGKFKLEAGLRLDLKRKSWLSGSRFFEISISGHSQVGAKP
ncbi:unnamed protein product [Meloidogyne enterolobii]|uniref:Uncharacterized protein n=1 Tax=Meloidogyne enterolobii TaxID=390850 RepID=A0ACB1B267_MELEN